ncbi:autotransporter outer membrane beta-barrel domain-containing protein [Bartonella taylorii]|uniref:Autotransporter outer membrane beta-barrel domain-containing protein n=1 Tax=Bartonella taylorii TaxID=33046 RepID=A0A9Q8YYU6_BARTA|nr:autotransporter outer membrane beta-barrel domain-containing protein [Bartonella taylorii]USP03528.1 autotransporter outer membrane beta-barrel domain-containing protein [Bartonella taylorii]
MNKIFKNHLSLCAFTTAVLFFVPNAKAQADAAGAKMQPSNVVNGNVQNSKNNFSCKESDSFYRCNDKKNHNISEKTYQKPGKNNAEEAAIEAFGEGTWIAGVDITIKDASNSDGLDKDFWKYGVVANDEGAVEIVKGVINSTNGVGVLASNRGVVKIIEGTIDFKNGIGVQTKESARVLMKSVSITDNGSQATDVNESSESSAFQMLGYEGYINLEEGNVKLSNAHGVSFSEVAGYIRIDNSTIVVEGNASYGFRFLGEKRHHYDPGEVFHAENSAYVFRYHHGASSDVFGSLPKKGIFASGAVNLMRAKFMVPNSAAIYSKKSGGSVSVDLKATLSGDLLLKAEDNSLVKVSADFGSTLVGGVLIDESSVAEFKLREGSTWTLTRPKNNNLQNSSAMGVSSISLIHLIDSSIVFEKPNSSEAGNYQTLRIGKGSGVVYKAQGNAHLYLNTYLNEGGSIENQRTDRVLIHGDVSGKTTVHVQSVSGSPGGATGSGGNDQGISIIQVFGVAEKDSFKLNGDYVALNNLPYQYRLRAYGPKSELGEGNSSQKLVLSRRREFWDFRLENLSVKSADSQPTTLLPSSEVESVSHSGRAVRSVVPQVPTYLLLPNSVFHAGLMDISNQNKQLEILRSGSNGMVEKRENPALYLRGYGGSYRYASDLSVLEYGYGGDLSYNGVEAGVLLKTIENADNAISFGVMGSYGKLSLQPQDVEQSQESAFDKWTATAYGSLQHETGLYVDGLLSYGLFKGDVVTLARGKTAMLKGNPLSVSLIAGQSLATGYEGFVLDPQVQVVYQHLQFDRARDIDGFDIEMGKLDQWVARIGGRLIKTPTGFEGVNAVAFYGKLYFAHGFGGNKSVRFKDAFQLGAFGSSLEAGLGLNAQLFQKFVLHADLIYQHKFTKAGFSGISFSGGLRYRF